MIDKYKAIKYHSFTRQWGNKKQCLDFAIRIDKWLEQFEENEKSLMLELLKYFYYYTEESVGKKAIELKNKFDEFCGKSNIKTNFFKLQKDYGVGFSDIFWTTFWSKNNLYNDSENNLFGLIEAGQVPSVITIVDDFSGSGDTFIKYINKLTSLNLKVKDAKINFLTLHITNEATESIMMYATSKNLEISLFSLEKTSKAFQEDYIYKKLDSQTKYDDYKILCDNHNVLIDHYFGYKDIQALVSFEYNTPNNTLGIFWHELDDFISLFKRQRKERNSLRDMQCKARQIKNINNGKPIVFDGEEHKLNMFMIYCLAWGKSFYLSKAIFDFGLTEEQLNSYMAYMIKNNYVIFSEDRFVASEKLENHLFSTRIKNFNKLYSTLQEEKKIPLVEVDYIPKNFSSLFYGYKKKGG